MPEIRRLVPSQAAVYRVIRLSSLATEPESFGSVHEIEAARPITAFEDRLASATVFGAWAADTIVGVAHFQQATGPKERHKGLVQGVFVEPAWRQNGLGVSLMNALITAACEHVEQLHLTVVQGNDAAIALYRRFGFQAYGIEPRALKTAHGYSDELLMALLLTE